MRKANAERIQIVLPMLLRKLVRKLRRRKKAQG